MNASLACEAFLDDLNQLVRTPLQASLLEIGA